MSTLLDRWDHRYIDRVRLLVDILPMLAQEPDFALKGGTAINMRENWQQHCRGSIRAISSM